MELDDALPLSGLQHLTFCPRQWALIQAGISAGTLLVAKRAGIRPSIPTNRSSRCSRPG
ncbi:MAG: hypothetical protein ABI072_00810 [Edaphobacter sp.]